MEQTIQLSGNSEIHVDVKDYKGEKGIDLRKYVKTQKYTGPTKSGLRVPLDKWDKFKELVNSIEVA